MPKCAVALKLISNAADIKDCSIKMHLVQQQKPLKYILVRLYTSVTIDLSTNNKSQAWYHNCDWNHCATPPLKQFKSQ